MGVVFGPRDVLRGRKWRMKKAARDLTPCQRETVEQILQRWEDEKSPKKIADLLGEERAKRLLKDLEIY
jgi:16S rRNA C1402 N4-methylase RsmH